MSHTTSELAPSEEMSVFMEESELSAGMRRRLIPFPLPLAITALPFPLALALPLVVLFLDVISVTSDPKELDL